MTTGTTCRRAEPSACCSTCSEVPSGPSGRGRARASSGHGGGSPHEGERELALEEISRSLEPGVTLVIAEIADPDPDVLDAALASLGGTVTRRPAADVYAEVQAAEAKLS